MRPEGGERPSNPSLGSRADCANASICAVARFIHSSKPIELDPIRDTEKIASRAASHAIAADRANRPIDSNTPKVDSFDPVDDLAERFARAERQGLIHIVRAAVDLPISELLTLVEIGRTGRLLGSLTVAECQSGLVDGDAVETQDKAQHRADYDARILAVLRRTDEPLTPNQVCDRVGGSAHDARVALQRLAAAKKITRVMKTGGHGYSAV